MNILQILPELNSGGVETGTVDMAKYLLKAGHGCVVVSAGGELIRELEAEGIKHYSLPVQSKAFWVMLKAARSLSRIIEKEHIDIIHARSRVPAWVAFMASLQTGTTLVTTAHGFYSKHIFSYIMGWGKYTIVPSSVIGRRMVEDFGVPLENIRLIPRSVDLERYNFIGAANRRTGKDFVVGMVGRIAPIKGHVYFLKAMAQVLRSFPESKAWIVGGISPGKDNYMEELEVWTRRLGLSHVVKFLGLRRDIPKLLSGMDCLVMPSVVEESFGRVIVEAQAVGVPVVATKVGGVVEIIEDGKDGILVEPKDSNALAEGILKILKDQGYAGRLAEAGRAKVEERYSLEKMAEDTIKVYRHALDMPRILVIKLSAIGDAVLSTASFAALKKRFPSSHITCLVGSQAKDVFLRCPYIDELMVVDLKGKDKGFKGLWSVARKLARRRFDMSIDFQNNKISHILSFATCSSRRYGYDNGKLSILLNKKVVDTGELIGPVQHQFRILEMLDIKYSGQMLELWPSKDDVEFADKLLSSEAKGGDVSGKPLIGINIGASPRWHTKRWVAKRISQLCDSLDQKGYRILLTGSADDAAFAKKILKDVKSAPYCAVGKTTFLQLAALISKCSVFVSSDSAPLHVAAAMHIPFVALFGPTLPERHLPPSEHFVVLRQKNCRPCYKDSCRRGTNACMASIAVKDVLAAVESLLKKG